MDNCTPELLARWTQMAAFTPFFRNHSNLGTIGQEPWAFGPEVEAVCRRSIELRYQLLPYLYGTFVQAHRHGTPIMRPLLWDYADDPVAVATGDQFLLGADLLVAPILRQGAVARSVYLPRGDWFDFRSGRRHKGEQHIIAHAPLDTLPVFVRAGAIIPMIPTQQFIGERRDGTIKVDCWPGAAGACHWYEDDGQSLAYESGAFLEREIISQLTVAGGTVRFAEAEGNHATGVKHWRVTLRGAEKELRAEVNGKRCPHRFDRATESVSCQIPNQPGPIELVLV
jgi:alpha-glucosidase